MDNTPIILRLFGFKNLNEATSHWVNQRLSSLLLIPLTVLFVMPFSKDFGLDYESAISIYKSPFRALIAFLFLVVCFVHFKQGAEEVIEDYIHSKLFKKISLSLNVLFCRIIIICITIALSKIVIENNWG